MPPHDLPSAYAGRTLHVLRVSNLGARHVTLLEAARAAEDLGLDALVIGDDGDRGVDPIAAAAALAPLTSAIGLVPEVDTARQHPFGLARRLTGLDQASAGRAGWAPRDAEPRRLAEAVRIVTALWDSWPDDAIRADKDAAVWVDVDRVRPVHLDGEHYRLHAPLDLGRSIQGQPLLLLPPSWPADVAVPAEAVPVTAVVVYADPAAVPSREPSPPAATLRARAGLSPRTAA